MNQQHGAVLGWATGKVQAVWFRAFVCEQAQRYHLTGYANNLSDGRVEMGKTSGRTRPRISKRRIRCLAGHRFNDQN